jgi:PAS domain S-box-containing protein
MNDAFKNLDYLNMLEGIIETSYDGIYITDGKANTILINKSYERITGLSREKLIGRNMSDLVNDKVISRSVTLLVLKSNKSTTLHQNFNTGKSALVTGTPFFDKNGNIQMVVTNVRDITELKALKEEVLKSNNENLKYKSLIDELKKQIASDEYIIAEDEEMLNLLLIAKRVAEVDTTVIIYGETGSGKELIAKYIYNHSFRKEKPFIKINCGAIPESLIESEFFGYAEGSFTGALKGGKLGIFEAANNGTLLLDEIGELPLSMQVRLLRVLQDGEIEKIGSNKPLKVDVRIIASTNRNLKEMVENKLFRDDLYYRLNVVPLKISPLRDRRSSIIPMAEYYLNKFNKKYKFNKTISREALKYLFEYNWPGNVRELKNIIEMLTVTTVGDTINIEHLPIQILEWHNSEEPTNNYIKTKLSDAIDNLEKELILKSYERYGNVRDAAKELGIDPSTFVRKRKKFLD